jgi:hypothetical protein
MSTAPVVVVVAFLLAPPFEDKENTKDTKQKLR